MAKKQDFTGSKGMTAISRMHGTIAAATAAPEAQPAQEELQESIMPAMLQAQEAEQEAQEQTSTRRPRKTYTAEEIADLQAQGRTAGRKGAKMPRMNVAFTPTMHDYILKMSSYYGMTSSEFIGEILRRYMEEPEHWAKYLQLKADRDAM